MSVPLAQRQGLALYRFDPRSTLFYSGGSEVCPTLPSGGEPRSILYCREVEDGLLVPFVDEGALRAFLQIVRDAGFKHINVAELVDYYSEPKPPKRPRRRGRHDPGLDVYAVR